MNKLLVELSVCFIALLVFAGVGKAQVNPYPANISSTFYTSTTEPFVSTPLLVGQCTWFVYGRIQETNEISLQTLENEGLFTGDARTWFDQAKQAETTHPEWGISVGTTPRTGAIGVWNHIGDPSGHVAFVESVDDSTGLANFTECNASPRKNTTVVICRDANDQGGRAVTLYTLPTTSSSLVTTLPKFSVLSVVSNPIKMGDGYTWYELQQKQSDGGQFGWARWEGITSGEPASIVGADGFSWNFTQIKLAASPFSISVKSSTQPTEYIYLSPQSTTPPPTITSVAPNPVIGSNNYQQFTVHGTGFVWGCNVILKDLTTNQPFPHRVVGGFSSTQFVLYHIFTTAAHEWSVQVINPDGTPSNLFDFNVVAPLSTWSSRSSTTSNDLYAVTYGNGMYVVVGANGTILTSPDGFTWKAQTSGTTQTLEAITYGNGLFVAGGVGGTILTSPDAINWTSQTGAFNYSSYTQIYDNVYTLTFGNNLFGLSGESALIQTSPNGTGWTAQGTFGLANLYGSTYGNGSFAFDGYLSPSAGVTTGVVVTSPDGVHWTQTSVGSNALHGVAYGNGTFVAVGDNGEADTSSDGIHWTAQNSTISTALFGICFGNGFVAVGQGGSILSSTDGVGWNVSNSGTTNDLHSACYANGTFVVVGNNGTILQSNRAPSALGFFSR